MKPISIPALGLVLALGVGAQDPPKVGFEDASAKARQRLEESLAELSQLREQIAAETLPLSRQLSGLEAELTRVGGELQEKTRLLDTRSLDLENLRSEIEARQSETEYLSGLLSDYIRNLESQLHIAEVHRYEDPLQAAKLAPENSNLSKREVYETQVELLTVSLDRLFEALGGTRFEGAAVDPGGLVDEGTFAMIGPAAVFRSADGQDTGSAELRLGSLEPAIIPFGKPEDTQAAAAVVTDGEGFFPLDVTLGNAHKIEATEETLMEHIGKGGVVMVPIFVLAGFALLVALYKWLTLTFIRKPSKKQIDGLIQAVAEHDEEAARQRAGSIKGPVGRMLAAGIEHLREPRELIEEVMYETVLTTRLKLQRLLPFVAICAASAPLLGLLGTVTGIINTFKLITVFGSGDVKTLSGGISEALITTEFGLIVAIPSLLLHAFLSRKARGVIDQMEKAGIALVNQISKRPYHKTDATEIPVRQHRIRRP